MRKYYLVTFLLFTINFSIKPQSDNTQMATPTKPKLVVGVVVDQMRNDYIDLFWTHYEDNGFKRLVNNGFRFKNNHFNYIPTKTAVGHTSIYTGTVPENHGIIANSWYDKKSSRMTYCTEDSTVSSIGTTANTGKMSPRKMLTTTITDENRISTQLRSKTIGIALKDRGAILPAGHTANAAYWFHGEDEGRWISSSYYMDTLPQWVQQFNESNKAQSYLKEWDTLYPISSYIESGDDKNNYELGFKGRTNATFPYDLKKLSKDNKNLEIIRTTPYGNDLTTDFALAAIEGEELGQGDETDFLTISYSSTDYIGHNFGVNSKEIEDTYIRLDKNIATLLSFLDAKLGKDNYIIFLTADHAGVHVPAYLKSLGVPAGYFDAKELRKSLEDFTEKEFGEKRLISNVSNEQVFLNKHLINEKDIDEDKMLKELANYILSFDYVHQVYTRTQLKDRDYTRGVAALLKNGFNHKRSGDILYVLEPSVITYRAQGSTHGSGYTYDTHVPLLFYGQNIKKGYTTKRSEIVDIAPTISFLLGISLPNSAVGKPLYDILDSNNN